MGGGKPVTDDQILTIQFFRNRVSSRELKRAEKILKRIGHYDLGHDIWILRKAIRAAEDAMDAAKPEEQEMKSREALENG